MKQDLKNRILSSKHILLVDSLILSLINFDFLTRVLETFWAMLASDFRAWEHTCWYSIIVFTILLFSFEHRENSLHVLFPILSKLDKRKKKGFETWNPIYFISWQLFYSNHEKSSIIYYIPF